MPELCHDLLRRSAALQLDFNQPTYDKLIPIYFGRENGPFGESQWGVIMIQDKNKIAATSPDKVFKEDFTPMGQKTPNAPKKQKTSKESTDRKSKKRKILEVSEERPKPDGKKKINSSSMASGDLSSS
jgi:hypothetical protein